MVKDWSWGFINLEGFGEAVFSGENPSSFRARRNIQKGIFRGEFEHRLFPVALSWVLRAQWKGFRSEEGLKVGTEYRMCRVIGRLSKGDEWGLRIPRLLWPLA